MAATLYLIPNTLGRDAFSALPSYFFADLLTLNYFVVEEEKAARGLLLHVYRTLGLTRTEIDTKLNGLELAKLNEHTHSSEIPNLLSPLVSGKNGGLISEAGLPAVADPGAELVRLAHIAGINVRPLVGPSSLMLALMASGLGGQRFVFHGYLPRDASERSKALQQHEHRAWQQGETQLYIETPYRNDALLQDLLRLLRPDTDLCTATDLTLPTESIQTHPVTIWRRLALPQLRKRPTVFLFAPGSLS